MNMSINIEWKLNTWISFNHVVPCSSLICDCKGMLELLLCKVTGLFLHYLLKMLPR